LKSQNGGKKWTGSPLAPHPQPHWKFWINSCKAWKHVMLRNCEWYCGRSIYIVLGYMLDYYTLPWRSVINKDIQVDVRTIADRIDGDTREERRRATWGAAGRIDEHSCFFSFSKCPSIRTTHCLWMLPSWLCSVHRTSSQTTYS
jgi:hypothetical protein